MKTFLLRRREEIHPGKLHPLSDLIKVEISQTVGVGDLVQVAEELSYLVEVLAQQVEQSCQRQNMLLPRLSSAPK